jgi:hypothetical protein
MADRKISDLTALTTPASGDYLPIVDISEVAAASKNKRITIEELMRGMPDGTAAAPSIAFESDPNTGIYSPGADQLAVSTGGTGRLFVDASGNVGIGTSSPTFVSGGGLAVYKVGDARITLKNNTTGDGSTTGAGLVYSGVNLTVNNQEAGFTAFTTTGTERLRIDSSGRLLVGTSTSRSNFFNTSGIDHLLQLETSNFYAQSLVSNGGTTAAGAAILTLARSRGTTAGSYTVVSSGDSLGRLSFQGADGTDFVGAAEISAEVDGTPGANDMPGRLVFSTTADGAASPTERLRITSAGVLQIADAGNITVGTTTGTKIGTATTQKLGFYDKTPVVQPIAVADATDAASAITQLNALLARMRDLGLIAT